MESITSPRNNRTAIITGAGIGIGFAIAKALVEQGVHVVLNDFDEETAHKAATRINALEPGTSSMRGNCVACPGDASDVAFIQHMVETAANTFGSVDIAIANAGITIFGDIFTTTPDAFQTIVNLNLRGSFFLAQTAARQMRVQQTGGSVLFMSSVVGHLGHPGLPVYSMTKAGLEMLAKQLVIDFSPLGITVNAIAPGATLTERTLDDPAYIPTWSRITPMGRPATVDDIANAALFLVSPASRHITGQSLVVDGGWTSVGVPPVN
ncbi:SDR family NAD(P)-dependent oxidoreductase [Spirosoma utsteinense]|uniref:3-oxoacyl-[acyl-carrier protein] reductase n=1 Tax=Spirosoma utsteinense TaxID=2585773 RepID=A0ABR6VZI9_9BACT|nr:SDR family oxidoreductase [Spirosoma utsteinense]MBC3784536.1 3-oxoacyl-[acyl-carrier protein] reductase [Spirosoma utsteinense]MBC3789713.1 3-oxoacyl-[acyl-carrier protein] reductase [Spirosoma utsteinense]